MDRVRTSSLVRGGENQSVRREKLKGVPSSKNSHFQNEAKCETFLVKMSFICVKIKIKKHFHINGFVRSLAFQEKLRATRKRHFLLIIYVVHSIFRQRA